MRRLALLVMLAALGCNAPELRLKSSLPVTCGPPNYACLYSGTDVQLPGKSPFNSTIPANTVMTLIDLSKARMSRVTDLSFGNNGKPVNCPQWSATHSGGMYDVVTNTLGTMISMTCGGGTIFLGWNPQTMHVTNLNQARTAFSTLNQCLGPSAWSRETSTILYCRPQAMIRTPLGVTTGSQLYSLTFQTASDNLCGTGTGSCPDPTKPAKWALVYDMSNCPAAPKTIVHSGSIIGLAAHDMSFSMNLSYTGVQDTARYEFSYTPGVGCSTFDSAAIGGATVYLCSGQQVKAINKDTGKPLQATWLIHDSDSNGDWVEISQHACVGADCLPQSDSVELWQPNTPYVLMASTKPNVGGHGTITKSYIQNSGNPTQWRRAISDLEHPLVIFQFPGAPNCCQERHFSGNILNDTDPILFVGGGPGGTPAAYFGEIGLMSVDGSKRVWRIAHNYSSNTPAAGFEGEFGIGGTSQNRTQYFFSSDMGGQLGTYACGTKICNITSIFAVSLNGQ